MKKKRAQLNLKSDPNSFSSIEKKCEFHYMSYDEDKDGNKTGKHCVCDSVDHMERNDVCSKAYCPRFGRSGMLIT
jgi:hypothetical protein